MLNKLSLALTLAMILAVFSLAASDAAESNEDSLACKAKELRERKFDLQQDEANRREMEKKERARKEQQALKSPEDPRDAEVDGELDELELERLAFERAERAVRDEEARLDAMQFAEEEAAAAELLAREATDRARAEAQRLFNEQDMQRRRRGVQQGVVTAKAYPEPPLRCALCHVVVVGARGRTGRAVIEKLLSLGESVVAVARAETPGVVSVPRWFAELMAKARFRGINLQWEVGDVTNADSLDNVFAGAKAVIFAVTATPESVSALKRAPKENTAEAVDNLGLTNVAQKAGEHAVERLIIISQAGVTRPVVSSLNKALSGPWGQMGKAMQWNILKQKRLGELAAIRECRETRGETTYTIIRPGSLGNSTYEGSWGVSPDSVRTSIGDNLEGNVAISRAEVAAIAVEAIFTAAAINRVVEVRKQRQSDTSGTKQNSGAGGVGGKGGSSHSGPTKEPARSESKDSSKKEQSSSSEEKSSEVSEWGKLFMKHRPGIGSYMSVEEMLRMAMLSDIKAELLMLSAAPPSSGEDGSGQLLVPTDATAVGFADPEAAGKAGPGAKSGGAAPNMGAAREL